MSNDKQIGEGSYEGAKDYKDLSEAFIAANQDGKIDKLAHDAEAALDGPEGAELEKAEEEARSHAKR